MNAEFEEGHSIQKGLICGIVMSVFIASTPAYSYLQEGADVDYPPVKATALVLDVIHCLHDIHTVGNRAEIEEILSGNDFETARSLIENRLIDEEQSLRIGYSRMEIHETDGHDVVGRAAEAMLLGIATLGRANHEYRELLENLEGTASNPNGEKAFRDGTARYFAKNREGFTLVAMGAPQVLDLLYEIPKDASWMKGKVPWKIGAEQRSRLIREIGRLFGQEIEVLKQGRQGKEDADAVTLAANRMKEFLEKDTYEEGEARKPGTSPRLPAPVIE